MTTRFAQAALMAAEAHAGQRRKCGNVPYINHPLAVAAAVAEAGGSEEMLCAAVLHDVVEDTAITAEAVEQAFGAAVAGIVGELTDPPEWDELSTIERKARQVDEYRTASPEARTIKIADQWSNVSDLAAADTGQDADYLAGYLRAARAVVAVCSDAAPDLAARFEVAGSMLDAKIRAMQDAGANHGVP